MRIDDLVNAFWGRFEQKLFEYGYSSLRNFCALKNMNYQVIAAARRRKEFPRLEDVILISDYLNVDINYLIYGTNYEEVTETREIKLDIRKANLRRFKNIFDSLQQADPIRIAAIEIILGIYNEK